MKNFRARLAEWRDRNHLTRDRAGELLGVTGHYVGMIERGDKEVDEAGTLARLLASYERDGLNSDSVIKEEAQRWGKRGHMKEPQSLTIPVSRNTHERITTLSREKGIPVSDLADLAVMQYLQKLENGNTPPRTKP